MPLFVLIYCFNILWLPAITLLGDGPLSHSRRFYLRRAWEAFSTGPVWWQAGPFPFPLLHVCACPPTAHFHPGTDSPTAAPGPSTLPITSGFAPGPSFCLITVLGGCPNPAACNPGQLCSCPSLSRAWSTGPQVSPCRQRSAPWQLCGAAAQAALPWWLPALAAGCMGTAHDPWAVPRASLPWGVSAADLQRAPQLKAGGVPQRHSTAAAVSSGHLSAFCQLNEMVPLPYSRCGPC